MSQADGNKREDDDAFEREVRRVVALLYPGDELGGAAIIDGKERDGIFITEDNAVVVEATTSREKSKAEKDGKKLKALTTALTQEYPFKGIKGLFVTQSDPTAHQLDAIRKVGPPVVALSFSRLKSRLIDARGYLEARGDHAFGSARDPETNATKVRDKYVRLDFVDTAERHKRYSVNDLVDMLDTNQRLVLLGDYGAGKSMTMRELYLRFRAEHLKRDDKKFCLHLNLNDHQGQVDPAEALIRHAQLIGFNQPHQLIRAWRSGEAHVLLDGFDEVFVPGWASTTRPLEDVRRKSVELVYRFVLDAPHSVGVVVAGREHFFDSHKELRTAFGLDGRATVASATDFTEEQVNEYLSNRQWKASLPDWLPRRPLIVGYLAGRRVFEELEGLAYADPGAGWDRLLRAICQREARADAGVDDVAIRQIMERLATLARRTSDGLGPLHFEDYISVFRDLRGSLPDEGAYKVLQRLPGLRVHDGRANSRTFVDDDLVDAARAGDVLRWIEDPSRERMVEAYSDWTNLLGEAGLQVLESRLKEEGVSERHVQMALSQLHGHHGVDGLRADLLRVLLSRGSSPAKPTVLRDLHIPTLRLAEGSDAALVRLEGCIIDLLDLSDVESAERLPSLYNCAVEAVEGVAGFDELAKDRLHGTTVAYFSDSVENTASILRLDISDYRRVMLTVLRRTFVQSGRSRKESAFYRGSLTMSQKELIPVVLKRLGSADVIRRTRKKDTVLWEPNLAMYRRVTQILDTPTTSDDRLLAE